MIDKTSGICPGFDMVSQNLSSRITSDVQSKHEVSGDVVELSEAGKALASRLGKVEVSIDELNLDENNMKLLLQTLMGIVNIEDASPEEKMSKIEELVSSLMGLTSDEITELLKEYIESIGEFGYKSE